MSIHATSHACSRPESRLTGQAGVLGQGEATKGALLPWCAEVALYIRWPGESVNLEQGTSGGLRTLGGLPCPLQHQEPPPGCSDDKLRLFIPLE